MAIRKDLTGLKFGRLSVIKKCGKDKFGNFMWLCLCKCGGKIEVNTSRLTQGITKSCGCLRSEYVTKKDTKHNLCNHKLYRVWSGMKERCLSSNNKEYKDYGGRGIKICDEWLHDFLTFYNWCISNGYLEGLSIDRINNDGNYEPSNCRFADRKTQNNNKSNCRIIIFNGESKDLQQWCESTGINRYTLKSRLKRGWSVENALTTPVPLKK